MHSDDGIVLRLPETDGEPPSAEVALFEPDEIEQLVDRRGRRLGAVRVAVPGVRGPGAAAAARATRAGAPPLWQQRQRAAHLLAGRQRLRLVPDRAGDDAGVPAGRLRRARAGRDHDATSRSRTVRLVEVETPQPSPFARSLLFGYVGMFLYEGDAPLAERRAQALSLDTALLAELLGQAELRELLDADAVAEVEPQLQRLTEDRRRATSMDSTADLLRLLGDLTTAEALARGATPAWLAELEAARRAIRVRIAGEERWIAIEDAGRVRDALGAPLPTGVPEAFTEPVRDPLGDLVARYARTHGPFHAGRLREPARARRRGGGGDAGAAGGGRPGGGRRVPARRRPGTRVVRRRGAAHAAPAVAGHAAQGGRAGAARGAGPVPAGLAGRRVGGRAAPTGVLRVVEQLAGAAVPASALETLVLPVRVADYTPALLDELTAAGEVIWAGAGALPGGDGWLALRLPTSRRLLLPAPDRARR